jgi:molybdenum cofactor synthesis domain-containing protein
MPRAGRRGTTELTGAPVSRPRAAALVIGNEILSGRTLDTNTQVLAQFLFARGVSLVRAETIGDEIPTIRKVASRLAATHDYVFTSGGIGPTLDDVTYAALGQAFGAPLAVHDETIARMRRVAPDMDLNEARRRMATLPAGAATLWTEGLWVPTVVLGGKLFVLPGVPRLYRQMLHAIPGDLVGGGRAAPRATAAVRTALSEGSVAALLDDVAAQFPTVDIGSYPTDSVTHPDVAHRTTLTLTADSGPDVAAAEAALRRLVDSAVAAAGRRAA